MEFNFSDLFDINKFTEIAIKYSDFFIDGFIYTIAIAICSVFFGTLLAIGLNSMRMSRIAPLRWIAITYIEITRGTPLLVQIFLIYYGVFTYVEMFVEIPSTLLFGFIQLDMFVPAVLAISLNSAAYVAEIIRAGIQAVDGGQTEAARSLGMTGRQTMNLIVMPQAIKNILPALANEFVVIIKESSMCMVIGIPELMFNASAVRTATYRPIEALVLAAVLYLVLTIPTSKIIAHVERRMSRGSKR